MLFEEGGAIQGGSNTVEGGGRGGTLYRGLQCFRVQREGRLPPLPRLPHRVFVSPEALEPLPSPEVHGENVGKCPYPNCTVTVISGVYYVMSNPIRKALLSTPNKVQKPANTPASVEYSFNVWE